MIFDNIMVDIETLGNESYSVILSIGAVEFDINTGITGRAFHKVIDIQSCLDSGLIVNGSTIAWWMQQSEEARKIFEVPATHICEALSLFSSFLQNETKDINKWGNDNIKLWGNSNRFDLGILQNAYTKLGLTPPWNFRNERDVRTLVAFAPNIKENFEFKGVRHNALDDCYHQIGYCTEIWKLINR